MFIYARLGSLLLVSVLTSCVALPQEHPNLPTPPRVPAGPPAPDFIQLDVVVTGKSGPPFVA